MVTETRRADYKSFDPEKEAGSAPSPCIGICRMNPRTALCDGCLRTIDEIAVWGSASESQKRGIWKEIRRRQQQCAKE